MFMEATVYATVEQVFYAVAKQQDGCIPKGAAVMGLQRPTREKAVMALNDWCANQHTSPDKYSIEMGYVPGQVTNHAVYHDHDWQPSKSTNEMRLNMLPRTTLQALWANNAQ